MPHQHPEAYCLMQFAIIGTDEREMIWNSRDGAPLYSIPARSGLGEVVHRRGSESKYAPDHVPALGDRIFVDLTEVRARQMTEERVARWELRESEDSVPPGIPPLRKLFRTRAACIQAIFEATFDPTAPDVVVVTRGYLERLLARREGLVTPEVRATAPEMPSQPEPKNPLVDAVWLGRLTGRPLHPAKMLDIIGRLSIKQFVRAMDLIADQDNELLLEHELANSICVFTTRVVDNSCGSAPRVYYESQVVNDADPTQQYVLGERRVFYSTEDEARHGHAVMLERVQRTLNGPCNRVDPLQRARAPRRVSDQHACSNAAVAMV